jgi:alkylation response protein AidB-like acyl-CoA dehydrogenase
MHVSAAMCVAAVPPVGVPEALPRLASGEWLATLAFSEKGSRSHFWAPVSRAVASNGSVRLSADKSFVTSAGYADLYVVSALSASEGVDLFAVPGTTDGLGVSSRWTGMGLRGNASAPMSIDVELAADSRLGSPGEGFRLMMEAVLPWFNLGNAAVSLGLAKAAATAAVSHAGSARFEHLGESLASLPTIRGRLARMQIALETSLSYLRLAASSVAAGDESAPLHVMAVKAQANDAALEVTDAAMRVCGGAAYARHLSVDRYFRDARAGHVMAPTADVLYDLYGKAITGQELF